MPVGILSVEGEDVAQHPLSFHLHPSSVEIILEGNVLMDNLENLPQAMCVVYGFTYALHVDYTKCMSNKFNFTEQVMLCLGKKEFKSNLLALTNQLVM